MSTGSKADPAGEDDGRCATNRHRQTCGLRRSQVEGRLIVISWPRVVEPKVSL